MRSNKVNLIFLLVVVAVYCFVMIGCSGNSSVSDISTSTTSTTTTTTQSADISFNTAFRTTTSTTTTTTTTTSTTLMKSTGNLTLIASYLPKQPKVGELVTFSFIMDDPDASVDYVCGNSDYGFYMYLDHIPCPTRGCYGQDIGKVYSPVHGHREWTQTITYTQPGNYTAQFYKRSGDWSGCNPYGDDVTLSLPVVVSP